MAFNLDKFAKLKAAVERLQTEADRAAGARDQKLAELREQYGCKTLKQAEALADKELRAAEGAERLAEEAFNAFVREHGELLDEYGSGL